MKIILGSGSKWRKQVMDELKVEYTVKTADIDEKAVTAGFSDRKVADPSQLTLAVANAKADAILKKMVEEDGLENEMKSNGYLLITCDQVVQYQGEIREKPVDEEECRKHLKSYISHPAIMYSAIVVTNTKTMKRFQGVDKCVQHFKPFPDDVVDYLIKEGSIMHTCGSLRIDAEEMNPYLGEREGTIDSVLGLPTKLLLQLLVHP